MSVIVMSEIVSSLAIAVERDFVSAFCCHPGYARCLA
jgi:hypothetical protein